MFYHFSYSLLLARRSRYAQVIVALAFCLIVFALLASTFSGRQPQTATLDLGISFLRWSMGLLAVLLAQDLIGKDIERRSIYTYLSYPTSRTNYLLGRFFAIACLLAICLLVLSAMLALIVQYSGHNYVQARPVDLGLKFAVVQTLTWLDCIVILAISILLCTISTTPNLVMILGIAAMLAARSIGNILEVLSKNQQFDHASTFQSSLNYAQLLLPDLSKLDIRMIALYDNWMYLPKMLELTILTPILYVGSILSLACFCFARREFS